MTGIFLKNMPLTFLKNIRLFNKKNHTPARAHPNARTRLTVVESRQAREDSLTTRMDTPPTRTGRADPSSFAEERRSTRPPTRAGKARPGLLFFSNLNTPPHARGQGRQKKGLLSP